MSGLAIRNLPRTDAAIIQRLSGCGVATVHAAREVKETGDRRSLAAANACRMLDRRRRAATTEEASC